MNVCIFIITRIQIWLISCKEIVFTNLSLGIYFSCGSTVVSCANSKITFVLIKIVAIHSDTTSWQRLYLFFSFLRYFQTNIIFSLNNNNNNNSMTDNKPNNNEDKLQVRFHTTLFCY